MCLGGGGHQGIILIKVQGTVLQGEEKVCMCGGVGGEVGVQPILGMSVEVVCGQ